MMSVAVLVRLIIGLEFKRNYAYVSSRGKVGHAHLRTRETESVHRVGWSSGLARQPHKLEYPGFESRSRNTTLYIGRILAVIINERSA